jgi:hypothetical protein
VQEVIDVAFGRDHAGVRGFGAEDQVGMVRRARKVRYKGGGKCREGEIMKATRRLIWMAAMAIAALFAQAIGVALAQEVLTVSSGNTLKIAAGEKPLTDQSVQLRGKVVTSADGKSLSYQAPDTTTAITETVKYSDDKGTHAVTVIVLPKEVYGKVFEALFVLFVLAVLLESGLAVIFNWRVFVDVFDARGVKTLVSVVFAYVFVNVFDIDIVTNLVNLYTGSKVERGVPGRFITALIIAGGSSGVNNLLAALGFRRLRSEEEVAPKPPKDKAWIAVRLLRHKAKGSVDVYIGPPDRLAIAGSITGTSPQNKLLRYFLRDRGRFPSVGGYAVEPDTPCSIRVTGLDADDGTLSFDWGPHPLGKGALLDIDARL